MKPKLKMKLFDDGRTVGVFKGDIDELDKNFKLIKRKYK